MALVTTLALRDREIRSVHAATTCTYTLFTSADNTKFVQIDTYGTDERQVPGKSSQTIQFNEQSAARLLEIFKSAFPNLA